MKRKNIKIWLKNKDKPIVLVNVSQDQIYDFTDFMNGNPNHRTQFVFDFPNGKHFVIFRSHVQAYEV